MLGCLRAGDILIADRAFCSYAFIAELRARGVHVVMRLHQGRARVLKANHHGRADTLQSWVKPKAKDLQHLHPQRVQALPETLPMRIVTVRAALREHRCEPLYFATTLLDAKEHDAAVIAGLYLRRWEVELFFDDIKTAQNMEMLRCQ